ncbi:hypothetical protein PTSG_09282 [Salpingoeca rosetta]|uniref:Uncharacterized protein n=1 Tax=Salpingoeca rosetta (strain ATCC 50818 / BSB-021) TaxID=946362 RepID=F2UN91_SALR5|nr:uncharacterized protein PTSG_09282 [Salpingoeca rosetta]EGD78590.1 hypothetical protein PTSG_09282 [Salpingoeca rosetta]|eukprot:XP_004989539.1 hypothetical protein PTSG_09282 [Salpingoeca rosetta]
MSGHNAKRFQHLCLHEQVNWQRFREVWMAAPIQSIAEFATAIEATTGHAPKLYYMFDAGEEFATSLEQLSTQLCNDGVTVARVYDVMLTFAQLNEPPHKLHAFLAASLAHHDA